MKLVKFSVFVLQLLINQHSKFSGGHTVGSAHCSLFKDRLYNYQNSGLPDQNMDPALLTTLRAKCPQNATTDNTADLDQNPSSALAVDNSFYRQIFFRRGVLKFDQDLASDPQTKVLVMNAAFGSSFPYGFGQAMVKLGEVQVLTGSQGEIRKSCRVVNNPENVLSALNIN